MLSINQSIYKLRDLCKVITGRTSSTPLARINRYLARYRDEYIVKLSLRPPTQVIRPQVGISVKVEALVNGRIVYDTLLHLPTSTRKLISVLTTVDDRAERALGVTYGGANARGGNMLYAPVNDFLDD